MKWNNNAGAVRAHTAPPAPSNPAASGLGRPAGLGRIGEEEEEEASEEQEPGEERVERVGGGEQGDDESGGAAPEVAGAGDVPQCFSHFTYEATDGEKLVCDLQASRTGNPRRDHNLVWPAPTCTVTHTRIRAELATSSA